VNMKRTTLALVTSLGLLASTSVTASESGFFDDLSYFAEGRYGTARVSATGISDNVSAFSVAGGIQFNKNVALRGEYMSTTEDTDAGLGWNVSTIGLQFERDAYRDGFGFYGNADHNSISADSGFSGDSGSFFGFGFGARYQISGGHRFFVDGKLHSGDFGFLGAGFRYKF